MKENEKMKVIYVNVKSLKPAEYNPRKANEKQLQELTDSITRFGFAEPIVVNKSPKRMNVVLGGHLRLKIANDLKMVTVPVVYVDIENINKEKELNLRLNKNTGEFDFDLLANYDEDI